VLAIYSWQPAARSPVLGRFAPPCATR